jgi:hypothetical protein
MTLAPAHRHASEGFAGSRTAKSRVRQIYERLQLQARGLHTGVEYQCYGFGERGRDYRHMLGFLTTHALRQGALPVLNDRNWLPLLLNKWIFHLHCRQFGIRSPQVYGVFDRNAGFTETGQPLTSRSELLAFLERRRPSTLVIKPLGGIQGKQVIVLDRIRYEGEATRVTTNTGETRSFGDLVDELERSPGVKFSIAGGYELALGGYLLQEKLQQHSLLTAAAPSTTNTVRVVTFRDRQNEIHIHATILRLGRHGNAADNWDRGGLAVAIDPATGTLGKGVFKPKYGGEWTETHPDSGVRFAGQTIPYWSEVLDICKHAARVTPNLRSVGWDVVVTADGPCIIEGNPDWDLMMVQVHTNGLLRTGMREQFAELGLRFPEERLPPLAFRDWWQRLSEAGRKRAVRGQR